MSNKTQLKNESSVELSTAQAKSALEQTVIGGDLKALTSLQRVEYYNAVCNSLNLNTLTRPFDYLELDGKLTLYARRDCTDQLRSIRKISIEIVSKEKLDELLYCVVAKATDKNGRVDESSAIVALVDKYNKPLIGQALANAYMKCESKAKRRVTLSIAGLGMLDGAEANTIPNAQRTHVNRNTGEIIDSELVAEKTIENLEIESIRKNLTRNGNIAQAISEWHQLSENNKRIAWTELFSDIEKEVIKTNLNRAKSLTDNTDSIKKNEG